jgi:hypothetical protein
VTTIRMYQHVQLFGREGHYRVRLDGNADDEHTFTYYDDALLFIIEHLAKARSETGSIELNEDTHVQVRQGGPALIMRDDDTLFDSRNDRVYKRTGTTRVFRPID